MRKTKLTKLNFNGENCSRPTVHLDFCKILLFQPIDL